MALIIKNKQIATGIYQLEAEGAFEGEPGQFYMLKASDTLDPFLPRPISIYDISDCVITFVYQKKGKGTELLSEKKIGDSLTLTGPFGNGFALKDEDTVFVGGGLGTAPLFYAVRTFKALYPHRRADVCLGFSEEAYSVEEFQNISDTVRVNIGGFITDDVDYSQCKNIIACGPEIMMKILAEKAAHTGGEIQASLERRMACAVGACLGCSILTRSGMRRVCKDGPVFAASEVFYEQA